MTEFEREASEQIRSLEIELRQLAERQRLIETKIGGLKMFLLAAAGVPEKIAGSGVDERVDRPRGSVIIPAQRVGVKEQILRVAFELLSQGLPMHTSDLLRHFMDQGIVIGGSNKIASISSILSRDGRFRANRSTGWSLKKGESPAEDGAFDLQPTP